jgi:hypothetical protein
MKAQSDFRLGGTFSICIAIAFPVVFFLFIEPVNLVIEQATPNTLPVDWIRLRNQWEYEHEANFVLSLVGFSALLVSVLVDTPTNRSQFSVELEGRNLWFGKR